MKIFYALILGMVIGASLVIFQYEPYDFLTPAERATMLDETNTMVDIFIDHGVKE